jgi:hypothetical protein
MDRGGIIFGAVRIEIRLKEKDKRIRLWKPLSAFVFVVRLATYSYRVRL